MAESQTKPKWGLPEVEDPVKEREDWLKLLNQLVEDVNGWVQADWATRVITVEMIEPPIGEYEAPVLFMQRDLVRIALEPITRFAPRTDGVVKLYKMPRFNDLATLYRFEGEWRLQYSFPGESAKAGIRNAPALEFNRENFLRILDQIFRNGS